MGGGGRGTAGSDTGVGNGGAEIAMGAGEEDGFGSGVPTGVAGIFGAVDADSDERAEFDGPAADAAAAAGSVGV
jgi:hypothetical protein